MAKKKKERVKQNPISDDGEARYWWKTELCKKWKKTSIRGSMQGACADTRSSANQAAKTQDVSEEQNTILYQNNLLYRSTQIRGEWPIIAAQSLIKIM